jgi:hypothetical protein
MVTAPFLGAESGFTRGWHPLPSRGLLHLEISAVAVVNKAGPSRANPDDQRALAKGSGLFSLQSPRPPRETTEAPTFLGTPLPQGWIPLRH